MKIGIDLVKISRMEDLKDPELFVEKILTPEEKACYHKHGRKAKILAGIFAAKEACSKCLKKGLGRYAFRDIKLVHGRKGEPKLVFEGEGRKYLKEAGLSSMDLSLTYEGDYALAICLGIDEDCGGKLNHFPQDHLAPELHSLLLDREKEGHKGTFGKVALIGGSIGMAGSIMLSSHASLKTGSGLSYALVPWEIGKICQIKANEVIVRLIGGPGDGSFNSSLADELLENIKDTDAIGLGPGMGKDPSLIDLLLKIFENYDNPIVLDADAINALARKPEILKRGRAFKVLTPHEMEMSRVSGFSLEEIRRDRKGVSQDFVKKYGVALILKGAGTVAAMGDKLWVNPSGNPGMATAGSGDVLTGILTALLGRGYKPWTAMRLAPYLHGLAGDFAAMEKGQESLLAGDILENIPQAFMLMESI